MELYLLVSSLLDKEPGLLCGWACRQMKHCECRWQFGFESYTNWLAMCVGAILATILSIYQEEIAKHYGKTSTTPEGRLYFSCIESALMPIGLFWFGKCSTYQYSEEAYVFRQVGRPRRRSIGLCLPWPLAALPSASSQFISLYSTILRIPIIVMPAAP